MVNSCDRYRHHHVVAVVYRFCVFVSERLLIILDVFAVFFFFMLNLSQHKTYRRYLGRPVGFGLFLIVSPLGRMPYQAVSLRFGRQRICKHVIIKVYTVRLSVYVLVQVLKATLILALTSNVYCYDCSLGLKKKKQKAEITTIEHLLRM